MKLPKKIILVVIFILVALISGIYFYSKKPKAVYIPYYKTQRAAEEVMTKEQMHRDIDALVQTLKNVHPKSYKGLTKAQEEIIASVYYRVTKDMKVGDFYFLANEIICSFKDAHTSMTLTPNSKDKILDAELMWLQDGLYAKGDKGGLIKGDRILSIGNKSVSQILKAFEKIIPAENTQWIRVKGLSNLIKEPYLNHLGLVNGGYATMKIDRQGEEITLDVPLVSVEASTAQNENSGNNKWVSYNIDKENSLGVFTLDSCINNYEYTITLRDFFQTVAKEKIQNIAVDVRNNTGGNSSVVDEFIKYLPVDNYLSYSGDVRYSKEAKEQRGHSKDQGYVSYTNSKQKNIKVEDSRLIFNGNIYILTSAKTFSSANWFAVIFKDNNMGKIIGEPTGNQPSSYGDILSFQLPESGILYSVSYKKWVRPLRKNDPEDSLHPDIKIYTTGEDVINGKDAVIEELKKIIKK